MIFNGERREIGDWRDNASLALRTLHDPKLFAWAVKGVVEERKNRTAIQDYCDAWLAKRAIGDFTHITMDGFPWKHFSLSRLGGINDPKRIMAEQAYDGMITLAAISEKHLAMGYYSRNFHCIPNSTYSQEIGHHLGGVCKAAEILLIQSLDLANYSELLNWICIAPNLTGKQRAQLLESCVDNFGLEKTSEFLSRVEDLCNSDKCPDWLNGGAIARLVYSLQNTLTAVYGRKGDVQKPLIPQDCPIWGRPIVKEGYSLQQISNAAYELYDPDKKSPFVDLEKFDSKACLHALIMIVEAAIAQHKKVPLESQPLSWRSHHPAYHRSGFDGYMADFALVSGTPKTQQAAQQNGGERTKPMQNPYPRFSIIRTLREMKEAVLAR